MWERLLWERLLEVKEPWIVFSISYAKLGKREYILLHVDEDDWKELAIYRVSERANLGEQIKIIEEALERMELDVVANEVGGIVDDLIIGEMPEEYCSGEIIASPVEDERLNWELCVNPMVKKELKKLLEHGLLPEEWVDHVKKIM